jgi:hypothetical protein
VVGGQSGGNVLKIVAQYSFNNGLEAIKKKYNAELSEIAQIIGSVDSSKCKTKKSKEKTMMGKMLYSPVEINKAFKKEFALLYWHPHKECCEYTYGETLPGYIAPKRSRKPFREMDFIKKEKKLGVEIQFGKYAFMVYDVCAKMTIFKNLGYIDTGIEIVPVKNFADEMSTGVSYFEQFAWDLEHRGVSNIDIPVLILGIDK